MTECERIRAAILESFDESGGRMTGPDVERHVRGCVSCQSFAQRHDELDTQLASRLVPPTPGATFRASLRQQIRLDITRHWHERVPDMLHLGGCSVVVTIYATLVPADRPMTLLVGMTGTLVTYIVMNMARAWFEEADCG